MTVLARSYIHIRRFLKSQRSKNCTYFQMRFPFERQIGIFRNLKVVSVTNVGEDLRIETGEWRLKICNALGKPNEQKIIAHINLPFVCFISFLPLCMWLCSCPWLPPTALIYHHRSFSFIWLTIFGLIVLFCYLQEEIHHKIFVTWTHVNTCCVL